MANSLIMQITTDLYSPATYCTYVRGIAEAARVFPIYLAWRDTVRAITGNEQRRFSGESKRKSRSDVELVAQGGLL